MSIIIWSAPDGSWGECNSNDLLIVEQSSLTDDNRDMLMGGNLSESEVRDYLANLGNEWFSLSEREKQVIADALTEAINVWRGDEHRESELSQDQAKSEMARRIHRKNACAFVRWGEIARNLMMRF